MNQVIYEAIMSMVFINMIEFSFMIAYISIRMDLKILSYKNLLIAFFISLCMVIMNDTSQMFVLNRFIIIMTMIVAICLAYKFNVKEQKKVVLHTLVAFILLLIIETLTLLPMVTFFEVDFMSVREDIIQTIMYSLPARVFEYLFLYILYLKNGGQKNEKVR